MGIKAVLDWENDVQLKYIYRIHGTKDEVFPIKYINADFVLEGGHMLVVQQSQQISKIIQNILKIY
jgi:hypothetical protein